MYSSTNHIQWCSSAFKTACCMFVSFYCFCIEYHLAILLPSEAMLAQYMLSFCVCLSVCLSQAGIVPKRLDIGTQKQHHTVAKDLSEISVGLLPAGVPNTGGVGQNWQFLTSILLYFRNGARKLYILY